MTLSTYSSALILTFIGTKLDRVDATYKVNWLVSRERHLQRCGEDEVWVGTFLLSVQEENLQLAPI